ncbi:MAG: HdeD family acid-resistance protein [Chthoniobacterales bacterium]
MSNSPMANVFSQGRMWYYGGGLLSLVVGGFAMARPVFASVAIAQIIGIFCLVSGVLLLVSALFGNAKKHRILDFFSAALRVIVGLLLILKVVQGVMALTLVLAAIFIAEGIFGGLLALRLRGKNPAWIWVLLNAAVAVILGLMLLAKFPTDADAIGLLFGVNSVFLGASLVMYAWLMPQAKEA